MKRRRRRMRALAVGVLLPSIMTGCGSSSTGHIQTSTPFQANTVRARTIGIYATSLVPGSEETTKELEGAVVEKLREGEAFERVYSSFSLDARVPDLSVKVTVTKFQGVSAVTREAMSPLLVGPVIGAIGDALVQSTIEADIVVRDGKTGAILSSATVRGVSSKVTIQAIQRTAEQIAGFVSQQ